MEAGLNDRYQEMVGHDKGVSTNMLIITVVRDIFPNNPLRGPLDN